MNNAVLHATALRELAAMQTPDPAFICKRGRLIQLLHGSEHPFARNSREHITVSAIVYRADTDALLMIYHTKLQRWLFPGGHVEEVEDESLVAAARRECLEETGFDPIASTNFKPQLIDVDIHPIPANPREPSHSHLDVRCFFGADAITPLINGAVWVPHSAAITQFPESIARPARCLQLIGGRDSTKVDIR